MESIIKQLIENAIRMNASDLHFMPFEGEVVIQIRCGTELKQMDKLAQVDYDRMVLHMKYWCSLFETDHRIPQSGIYVTNNIGVRVTFLPSFEQTLMSWRLPNVKYELENLLAPQDVLKFQKLSELRQGLLLIGGATGAGKTTVLYAFLESLNGRRIVAIENPPEKQVCGVIQLEVNSKAGLDYRILLKETLRADPDIIVIGEIRTTEELNVALDASLSGHLTIATFHTSSIEDGEVRLEKLAGKLDVSRYWCVLNRTEEVTCSWSV